MVISKGPLVRGVYVVVGAEVAAEVGYFPLRSGMRWYGDDRVDIWMVGVSVIPVYH